MLRTGFLRTTAVLALLVPAAVAHAAWIIAEPPITGQRHCEFQYDSSAPIEKWRSAWAPFETLEACEALRTEMVRRTTAPGWRERRLEQLKREGRERAVKEKEADRDLARALRPHLRALRRVARREAREYGEAKHKPVPPEMRRDAESRICEVSLEDWTKTRCIERTPSERSAPE